MSPVGSPITPRRRPPSKALVCVSPDPTNAPIGPGARAGRWRPLLPLVPVSAALFAHCGSLDGGLIFDDRHVLGPGSAMAAGDWWQAAFGDPHTSLANRPLTALSLCMLRIGDSTAAGYRWGSLVIHLVNAWLLFTVIRSSCTSRLAASWVRERATSLATAIASLWACHPLTVDAVAYPTQRSMLVMGTCFLFALHCLQRDALRRGFTTWKGLAVVATAAGMCSKEEFVAAPILLILFERALLSGSWRELRSRRTLHVMLCSTWLLLAACVVGGPHNPTVGFSTGVGPIEWLCTQSFVVLHYLTNVPWPFTLRGAYDQGVVDRLADAAVPVLGLTTVAVVAALQWGSRPWLAWLAATFFLFLGPTTSFFPIVTEPVADRRMYLPMVGTMIPLALLVIHLGRRLPWPPRAQGLVAWVVTIAMLSVAVVATRRHSERYRDQATFWNAAYRDNELSNRSLPASLILSAYAEVLQEQGKEDEAIEVIRRAMECPTRLDQVPLKYAELLWKRQDLAGCERVLRELARRKPNNAKCRANLASVLLAAHERDRGLGISTSTDPRLDEARHSALAAYAGRMNPADLGLAGLALSWMGRPEEAEAVLQKALRAGHRDPVTLRTLCSVLVDLGRADRAAELAGQLQGLSVADVPLLTRVMETLRSADEAERAIAVAKRILAIDRSHVMARTIVASIQSGK